MGEIYLAEDTTLGRQVAIKFLPSNNTANEQARKRLLREARAAAALDHGNICAIYEVAEADGQAFIVMQYVEGETLDVRIQAAPPDWNAALRLAVQIADALAEAHSHGIVHRDIKPQNIMVTRHERVKVLDFGLAKIIRAIEHVDKDADTQSLMTQPGMIVGTVPYMSPEQLRGEEIDSCSDIFSFGTLLYEMLSGRKPFGSTNSVVTISAILSQSPPPLLNYVLDVPVELEQVVLKCLEKDKTRRYQSAQELARDLRDLKPTITIEALSYKELKPPRRRFPASLLYVVLAAALIIGAVVYLLPRRRTVSSINSIAVLPLENSGGDPNVDYLTEGLTDSLIDSLSQLPDMKVIAHTSVYRYRGKEIDPQAVGNALGVQALLTGRIAQRGDSLSISIELINAGDRSYLWGVQFTRNLSDLATFQREIAQRVAQRLRGEVSGEDERRLNRLGTQNTEALQLYTRGHYFWNKRTAEGLNKSIEFYRQATQIDPNYALAYVGLADSYSMLNAYSRFPQKDAITNAREAAKRALELDPNLAEGHTALATIAFTYDWNWAEAEKEYRSAIELNRNSAMAHDGYAMYLTAMGRHDEAIAESELAQELDPLSLPLNTHLARSYYMARQYDKAIEQCRKTSEIDENFPLAQSVLGSVYEQKGMYTEAINAFDKANELARDEMFSLADLGLVYARSGQTDKASAILEKMLEQYKTGNADTFDIALVYMSLDKKSEAFAWLDKAYEERSLSLIYLKSYPRVDSLRTDERFLALLQRIGLN